MILAADEPVPTVVGALALSRNPRSHLPCAYIQFLRVDGSEWSDTVADEALCEGPLSDMIGRLDAKLDAHNRTAVDITGADREVRTSLYPREALQQLTRNAIMHRTYEATHAPVRVYWFNDRIEILNPGGPFGNVTAENFGQPGETDYRNPNVADAMRVLNLVQRFGVGILIAQKTLADNGTPPAEFKVDANHVTAILRPRAM